MKSLFGNLLIYILGVIVCFLGTTGTKVPASPCPNIFNYYKSKNNEIYGNITINNDRRGIYSLQVEMYFMVQDRFRIRLLRRTGKDDLQKGRKLEYLILFPQNVTVPSLRSISFQGNEICFNRNTVPRKSVLILSDVFEVLILKTNRAPFTPNGTFSISRLNEENCGVATKSGKYPWEAGINILEGALYAYKCAGTLLTRRHVITAAQCLYDSSQTLVAKRQLAILLGDYDDVENWFNTRLFFEQPSDIIVHPEYVKPSHADVAIIKLERIVILNDKVLPICMLDGNSRSQKNGMLNPTDDFITDKSQPEIILPILDSRTCLNFGSDLKQHVNSRSTFCAGPTNHSLTGKNIGTGLVVQRNGKYYLKGILSKPFQFSIFVDLSMYLTWLSNVLID